MMLFCKYFILYILYSIIGWIMEVIDTYFHEKKFVNRGFLIGPYCPIYGKGALLVIWLLKGYIDRPIGLFIMSIVICSIIEYFGSVILEKVFNTRWWDYSNKKFNINGRICLETMIPFGIGCTLMMYIINPFFTKIISIIPKNVLIIATFILLTIYIIDVIISFKIIWKFKDITKNARKDNTEKVTEYVKEKILNTNKILYTRLIHAFPKLTILKKIKQKNIDNK